MGRIIHAVFLFGRGAVESFVLQLFTLLPPTLFVPIKSLPLALCLSSFSLPHHVTAKQEDQGATQVFRVGKRTNNHCRRHLRTEGSGFQRTEFQRIPR